MTTPSSRPRQSGRFIASEDIAEFAQWDWGSMDAGADPAAGRKKVSASDLAKYQAAFKEGYDQGLAQGHAEGLSEAERRVSEFVATQGRESAERLTQLLKNMEARLLDAQQDMAQAVLEMACEVARQVIRRELSVGLQVLQPVIREALTLLVSDGKPVSVHLNPAEHIAMHATLERDFAGQDLRFVPDATVAPGGCLVLAAGSVVDGTLARRWTRAIGGLGMSTAWENATAPESEELPDGH